jgi:2-succinyl-5-enolpyruvyl-6-hydroxy-3-cyclohexene-1-carboxylate synthase
MTPENLLTEWARLLVVSLADAGVSELVVSPGARSTPFVAAALASGRFRMTSIIDERAAGFFAVGQAKVTGKPSALICTSGSAAANYFPAVVEAATARVPLLVITADRPFELHDCGAPQTFDQTRLYGVHVRRFVDLGAPDGEPAALAGLRRRAAQSVADALGPEPGPVHLNARARKPLEPAAPRSEAGRDLVARVDAALATAMTRSIRGAGRAPAEVISAVADSLRRASRGLVVCGPAELADGALGALVGRVARATGFPVYAETTSQLRLGGELPPELALDSLDVLLRIPAFAARFEPDVVLQIGESPTSAAWDRLVAARPALERHVVARGGWPDPNATALTLVVGEVADALAALGAALGEPAARPASPWTESLVRANRTAWRTLDIELSGETLSEGGALRAVAAALPPGALLALGNSLPVRHADAFCPARAAGVGVFSQRGLSGIDGLVAGAAGAANASGRPTVLVLGDVSAVHDLGGFQLAREATVPLVVVILDNGGGRIFEQLPLASAGLDASAERFWTTPPGVRFAALEGLFGVRFERVETVPALRHAVMGGLGRAGCTVVQAVVPPHGAREEYARVLAAVEQALAREAQ